jgi:hypothetical protein
MKGATFEDLGVDEMIIVKWILQCWGGSAWTVARQRETLRCTVHLMVDVLRVP